MGFMGADGSFVRLESGVVEVHHPEHVLGVGSTSRVVKGTLAGRVAVAIKVLRRGVKLQALV
jgi:hypothetical protein